MQMVLRDSDELAQVTTIAALTTAPSKSKVSRWMEAHSLNNAENAMYRHASLKPPPMAPTMEPHKALMAPPPPTFAPPAPTFAGTAGSASTMNDMATMMSQWMTAIQRGGGGSHVETIFPSDSASQVGGYGDGGRGGRGRGRGRGGDRAYKNVAGGVWVPVWTAGPNECWKCGVAGHGPQTCQIPQSGQKCQGCGLVGHIAPTCPTNKRCL